MAESERKDPKELEAESTSRSHQLSIRRETESEEKHREQEEAQTPTTYMPGEPERLLFTPPIDIFGTEEGLVLRADLPGVNIEGLELQIEDNKLTLFGRVESVVPDNAKLLHQEYQVGDFYRSFILSDEVDYDRISAKMNHGVLEIQLPRVPRARPRKIQVQSDM